MPDNLTEREKNLLSQYGGGGSDASQYANALGSSSSGLAPRGAANASEPDYYTNLKNESYKTMLKKEVQAAVAQDQARKYTVNSLRGAGISTQGVAGSMGLGIGNAYAQALSDAQNEYSTQIANINEQQRQEELANGTANSNADYELLAGAIRNASTPEELELIKGRMAEFGLDENSARSLNFLYELQNQQINSGSESMPQYDGTNFFAYNSSGKTISTTRFVEENKTLATSVALGEMPKDAYVQLVNDKGERCYLYYSNNGTLSFISKNEFENNSQNKNRYSITRKEKIKAYEQQKTNW